MNKRQNILLKVAGQGLLCISGIMLLFLTWYSFRFTCYIGEDYYHKILTKTDSMVLNLAVLFFTLICCYALGKFSNQIKMHQIEKWLLPVSCIVTFMISAWWAFASNTTPEGDQLYVAAAAVYASDGTLDMLNRGGYLFFYPQQLGLIALYEIIFAIFGDFQYGAIYILYSLMNAGTVICGSRMIKELDMGWVTNILYLLLMPMCLPYLLYTPYVYGDLPSIFLCMALFLCLVKWGKRERTVYLILACLLAALAVLVRRNSLIVVCGVVVGLLLFAIEKKKWQHVVACVLIVVSVFLAVTGINSIYEKRCNASVDKGMPALLYIAMGMQESENAPGRYNNYTKEIYQQVEFDREKANALALDEISRRWQEMKNPQNGIWNFYREKIVTQWNEPLFEVLLANHTFEEEPMGLAVKIYEGSLHQSIKNFCDRYQFLIYMGALLAIPFLWKKESILWCTPIITFVGGFLFSIIWEAQCRYVLPYYIFIIPYAAYGLTHAAKKIGCKINSVYAVRFGK